MADTEIGLSCWRCGAPIGDRDWCTGAWPRLGVKCETQPGLYETSIIDRSSPDSILRAMRDDEQRAALAHLWDNVTLWGVLTELRLFIGYEQWPKWFRNQVDIDEDGHDTVPEYVEPKCRHCRLPMYGKPQCFALPPIIPACEAAKP